MFKAIERGTFDPRTSRRRRISEDEPEEEEKTITTYWDIVINAMSKLGKMSIADVDDMTLTEYFCLVHANYEKELYNEYILHKQAFASREVEAKKNVGSKKKPKEVWRYKDFNAFFNYEKALNDLRNFEKDKKNTIQKQNETDILNAIAAANRKKMQNK